MKKKRLFRDSVNRYNLPQFTESYPFSSTVFFIYFLSFSSPFFLFLIFQAALYSGRSKRRRSSASHDLKSSRSKTSSPQGKEKESHRGNIPLDKSSLLPKVLVDELASAPSNSPEMNLTPLARKKSRRLSISIEKVKFLAEKEKDEELKVLRERVQELIQLKLFLQDTINSNTLPLPRSSSPSPLSPLPLSIRREFDGTPQKESNEPPLLKRSNGLREVRHSNPSMDILNSSRVTPR